MTDKSKPTDSLDLILDDAWTIFTVFLILKLTNLIDWTWVWIFSPLWLSFVIYFIEQVIRKTIQKVSLK